MELVLDRVTKQYGAKLACDRVSARMGPGVYGLLGANGAGKTTLMRMICGVLRPTSGSIRFGGMEVDSEAYRASLGYLPQEFGYYPEFTAQDFLLYLAALKGLPRQQAGLQTEELLELVGLALQRRKKIRTFSGGMRRRLGIAQALLGSPQLLVLDEPTAGLDPAGRENLMANIRDYHRNKKRTIILVSHSMDEIAQNVDRILVLKSAHVLMSGTPAEVFARAEELLSAGLDVPQVTRIAMRLREQGLAIDPAVYTVQALERELLALRRGETVC